MPPFIAASGRPESLRQSTVAEFIRPRPIGDYCESCDQLALLGCSPRRADLRKLARWPAKLFQIESTVRYLGIEVDDATEIAEKIDI